jgi:hypothetical protein
MEPLESLERYAASFGTAFVYHLADGRRYVYGDEQVLSAPVLDIEKLFSTSMLKASRGADGHFKAAV